MLSTSKNKNRSVKLANQYEPLKADVINNEYAMYANVPPEVIHAVSREQDSKGNSSKYKCINLSSII